MTFHGTGTRLAVIAITAWALSGCDDIIDPMADEMPGISGERMAAIAAASQSPPALKPGDRFAFDNPQVTWQVVTIGEDGQIAWQADNGETQITASNPLLPALEWHSPERGNGRRLISNMNGSMFPLEAGKTVSFRSTVDTDAPPYAWEFDWTCTTGRLAPVTVPAGTFPAYRIACGRQQPEEIVFHYAPEVGNYVRLMTADANGGPPQDRWLLEYARASAPMQQAGMPVPPQGDVKLESEQPDQMNLSTGTDATMQSGTTSSGPTALGMIAGESQQGMTPAPAAAPQSGLTSQGGAPETMAAAPNAGVPPGTVAVHIASYKDPGNAETGWKQLLAGNRDQLEGTRPLVRKVDLGTKGIFYRLHAGPIAGEARAKEICRILAQRGVYCKVAKL